MSRRTTVAMLSSAMLLAVACSEAPTTPTAPSTTPTVSFKKDGLVDDEFDGQGNKSERHLFELANSPAVGAARSARGGGSKGGGTGISYHGGTVLQGGTNVVSIYWGNSTIYNGGPVPGSVGAGAQDGSLVGYFLSHLGGSSYFNINTTYWNAAKVNIANVVNYNGFWASTVNVPTGTQSVSDAQMVAMLQSGFTNGQLSYDPSTLYVIFSAGQVNLGGGFHTSYCAYHSHATVSVPGQGNKTIYYAAQPYVAAYPTNCTNQTASPNGDAAADGVINVLAHEIEETTTDAMGNAWYDTRGYENADKCAWNFGTTTTSHGGVSNIQVGAKWFLVQQNWVNSGSGGCRQGW